MINFDDIAKENTKTRNPNWPQTLDHNYIIVIICGSGYGWKNTLLNLISNQPDNDKIYSYANDLYAPEYQLLINKVE